MLIDSDFLPLIVDYLGFVPSRFFLCNTCREAKKRIPAKMIVSHEELDVSIRNNLMPVKNLIVKPLTHVTSDQLGTILAIESVADRCALLDQLLQTISPTALAQSLSWPEIEKIKWTAWLSRCSRLLKLAISAREKKRPRVPHFETEFLIDYKEDFYRFFKSDPIEYLSVVLRESTIPRTKDDWDFLIMNSLATNAKRCLNFILTLSNLNLGEFPGVIAATTEGGDLNLLQHVIQCNDPNHPFIRDQMLRALQISTRNCMTEATAMILKSLGPNCLSSSNYSLLHSLAMGNEVGKKPTVELAKLLVSYKANISVTNREDESAIDIAAVNKFSHLIEYYKSIGGKSSNMRRYLLQEKNFETFKSVVGPKGEYIDPKWIKKEKENPTTVLEYASLPKNNSFIFLFLVDLLCLNNEKREKLLRDSFWAALENAAKDGLFAERLDLFRAILKRAPNLAVEPKLLEGILPMGRILCVEPPHRRVWDNKVLPQADLYESLRLEPRRKVDDGSGFDDGDEDDEEYMFGPSDDEFEDADFSMRGGSVRRHNPPERRANEPETVQKPKSCIELAWDQATLNQRQVVGISAMKNILIACGADANRGFTAESLGYMVNEKVYLYIQPYTKKFLEFMIQYGADVNSDTRDRLGQRPIEMYASVGCLTQTKVLVENGAKIDSDLLVSASATTTSNVEVLNVLLGSKNCNVNGLIDGGIYNVGPIHAAAQSGGVENCSALIKAGADVNLRTGKGNLTPLMLCFMNKAFIDKWKPVGTVLVRHGADLNARDANGQTAIFVAAIRGQLEEFKWLLHNGADPFIPDIDGVRLVQVLAFIIRSYPKLIERRVKKFNLVLRQFGDAEEFEYMDTVWFPCEHREILALIGPGTNFAPPKISDKDFAKRYGLTTITEYL